jgi:hypothetical protein
MTGDVEELLRECMDRLAAEARIPAGLTRRARQRNRRRQIAIRGTVAAGTAVIAAVAAIAVIATAGSVPRSSRAASTPTIAYVTSQAQNSLTAVVQAGAIEVVRATARRGRFGFTVINVSPSFQEHPTGSAILPGVLGNVKAQRTTYWSYRGSSLQEGFSATGQLVFSSVLGTVTSAAGQQVPGTYGAAYTARTRWRVAAGQSAPLPKLTCRTVFPVVATPNLAASIAKALSCKLFTLDGRQQVRGVSALKLVMRPQPGLPLRQTLWVDPSSYLPLRGSASFLAASGPPSVLIQDYQWLPPTAANLAALHATIRRATTPAGFRTLPATDWPAVGFEPSSQPQV